MRKAPKPLGYGKRDARGQAEKLGVVLRRRPRMAWAGQLLTQGKDLKRKEPEMKGPFRVLGRKASDIEYRTYQTLLKLGWGHEIEFQVDVLGGRMPGGAVLDYVVWTYGGPVILEVNGDYWHSRGEQMIQEDLQRRSEIAAVWDRPFYFYMLTSGELESDEKAYATLLPKVGKGI